MGGWSEEPWVWDLTGKERGASHRSRPLLELWGREGKDEVACGHFGVSRTQAGSQYLPESALEAEAYSLCVLFSSVCGGLGPVLA